MFAKIENNQIVQWPIPNLTPLFPNTSFPSKLTDHDMPDGYVMVGVTAPPQPGPNQKVVPGQPIQQDGKWVQSWDVVDMLPEEIQERANDKALDVRSERSLLLSESDWTQLADSTADKAAWATYRQALRDITTQVGFPWTLNWPLPPQA